MDVSREQSAPRLIVTAIVLVGLGIVVQFLVALVRARMSVKGLVCCLTHLVLEQWLMSGSLRRRTVSYLET